jgi:hypothetical protein
MHPAKLAWSVVHAGVLITLLATPACAKTPPAAQSATSASDPAPTAAGAPDTTLPLSLIHIRRCRRS